MNAVSVFASNVDIYRFMCMCISVHVHMDPHIKSANVNLQENCEVLPWKKEAGEILEGEMELSGIGHLISFK